MGGRDPCAFASDLELAVRRGRTSSTPFFRLPAINLGPGSEPGLAHIHGFPRGWLGVALATVYGLMTRVLRMRSRGLVAPLVAHVAADATIFGTLATLAQH